tara:strand:- start:557 stop:991 length:435 start_codon:yes stop_codon:yes gene_type:complete
MSKPEIKAAQIAVSRDVAEKDLERWLNYKRIGVTKRENMRDNIDILVDAVQDGQLVVEENCSITQKLAWPPENEDGEVKITSLSYVPRMHFSQIQPKLKGIKPGDTETRLLGYAAALSSQPIGILRKLDTVDLAVMQAVAVFFL